MRVYPEKQVCLTKSAGGEFIISPDTTEEVIKKTKELGMVSIPRALTPSEITLAHKCGADFEKYVWRNESEIYGFFMGAVLQAEIDAIIKAKENKIIIAGKRQIKNTMVSLLGALCSKKIICISDKTAETAPDNRCS